MRLLYSGIVAILLEIFRHPHTSKFRANLFSWYGFLYNPDKKSETIALIETWLNRECDEASVPMSVGVSCLCPGWTSAERLS